MVRFRKALCLAVALLMVAMLVFTTGCTGTKEEKAESSKKTEETSGTEEKKVEEALQPVTLKWYFGYAAVDKDREQVFSKMNEIIKEKINATVEFNVVDFSQWSDKINVLLSSGENIDISWHNWVMSYAANVSKGMYKPLDDLLAEYGKGILNDIPKALLDIQRVNGKIYAIPNYQISTVQNAYLLKKDVVDSLNFDVSSVKSYKDLGAYAELVKSKFSDLFPLMNRQGILWGQHLREIEWELVIKGIGNPLAVKYGDTDKKVFNMYATEDFKEYCELVHEWYNKGYIREDVATVTNAAAETKAGKYATIAGGTLKYPGAYAAETKAQVGYDLVEAITSRSLWESTAGQATMNTIPSSSKNPERAMMLLNLLNDDQELANLFAYGFEGTHYEKLDNGQIKRIKDSGYDFNWQWAVLNTFKIYLTDNFPVNHNEQILKTHADSVPSNIAGFVANTEPFLTELTQCQTAYNEIGLGLQTGVLDPKEYLPKFLDTLERAGVNKILTEVQKQIDQQLK